MGEPRATRSRSKGTQSDKSSANSAGSVQRKHEPDDLLVWVDAHDKSVKEHGGDDDTPDPYLWKDTCVSIVEQLVTVIGVSINGTR